MKGKLTGSDDNNFDARLVGAISTIGAVDAVHRHPVYISISKKSLLPEYSTNLVSCASIVHAETKTSTVHKQGHEVPYFRQVASVVVQLIKGETLARTIPQA